MGMGMVRESERVKLKYKKMCVQYNSTYYPQNNEKYDKKPFSTVTVNSTCNFPTIFESFQLAKKTAEQR